MWSRNYNRIINRFQHIIKGQFFGHTHFDEFEIFYEDMFEPLKEDKAKPITFKKEKAYKATNIAYIGPSITTFGNVNPGYRIYVMDEDTFDIVDHHTYTLNLTEANIKGPGPLEFHLSYSAKETYGLKSLAAQEWHRLLMRMRTPVRTEDRVGYKMDEAERLFKQFYRFHYNKSDNIGKDNQCQDESCKYEVLCRLMTALSHDTSLCQHFLLWSSKWSPNMTHLFV